MPALLDEDRYESALNLARNQQRGGFVQQGTRNRRAVTVLQQHLSDLGYNIQVDGLFGNETNRVLRHFQHDKGLKTDGIVGRHTLKALTKSQPHANGADPSLDAITQVVAPGLKPNASPGSGLPTGRTGASRRSARGSSGGRSSSRSGRAASTPGFNAADPNSVKQFQRANGLKVDGVVGPQTQGALQRQQKSRSSSSAAKTTGTQSTGTTAAPKGAHGGTIDKRTGKETATAATGPIGSTNPQQPTGYSFDKKAGQRDPSTGAPKSDQPQDNNPAFNELHPRDHGKFAKKGDSGPAVTNTQQSLNQVGNYKLKQDGQFGPKTETAVKAFQAKNGLKVDGIVGLQTSGSIRRQLATIHQNKAKLAHA